MDEPLNLLAHILLLLAGSDAGSPAATWRPVRGGNRGGAWPRKLSSAVVGWVSGLFEALAGYAQPLLYLLQVPIAADMMGALVPWRGREEEKRDRQEEHLF